MRYVEAAAMRPHHCAAIPFSGMHSPGGFIDTGVDLPGWDPHVYISRTWVDEAARFFGWTSPQQADQLNAALADKDRELEQLRTSLAEREKQLEAVQVLKNTGFEQARKPGRPKTKAGV